MSSGVEMIIAVTLTELFWSLRFCWCRHNWRCCRCISGI